VHLLRFVSAAAQKAALTRLSLFLEDREHRGAVLAAPPAGRVAGPASYSGHNCRAEDAARFFNQARRARGAGQTPPGGRGGGVQCTDASVGFCRDTGVALTGPEAEVKALLEAHGLLTPARDGRCARARLARPSQLHLLTLQHFSSFSASLAPPV
jgi:hypothetical protein